MIHAAGAIIGYVIDTGKEAKTVGGRAVSSLLRDVYYQTGRGVLPETVKLILQGIGLVIKGKPINDRELLLEHGVSFLQNLPPGSLVGNGAAEKLIEFLWLDLPHPPASHVGTRSIYRAADGSGNNALLPELGRAGLPYAKSVAAVRPKPASLPDPGLVFDMLLRRDDNVFREHPSGISSLFFAMATIVIQ
ncbi:hypothetical protein P7C70_g3584, partial [Phenoliferia sp. Uapishka_3]